MVTPPHHSRVIRVTKILQLFMITLKRTETSENSYIYFRRLLHNLSCNLTPCPGALFTLRFVVSQLPFFTVKTYQKFCGRQRVPLCFVPCSTIHYKMQYPKSRCCQLKIMVRRAAWCHHAFHVTSSRNGRWARRCLVSNSSGCIGVTPVHTGAHSAF